MDRSADRRSVVVLESFRPNPVTNPYLLQLLSALEGEVEVLTFSWPRALVGRYDVFHLHWPEVMMRGRDAPRTIARCVLFAVLLLSIRLRRRGLVRTLHNVTPHDGLDPVRRALLAWCDRWTTSWITLTSTTEPPNRAPSTVIPIGHHRGWYPGAEDSSAIPGRTLFFGLIRAYKGIEELLVAAAGVRREPFSLRVAGRIYEPKRRDTEPRLGDAIDAACARDGRITASIGYLADDDLASEIRQSQLVVLPFRNMVNSSSVVLALSLGRPVLVPSSPSMLELRAEVGDGWVLTYDGEITPQVITDALDRCDNRDGSAIPDLSRREWDAIGAAHAAVFAGAVRRGER